MFGGIDGDFLSDVISLSKMHFEDIDEERKEDKIRGLLKRHGKHTDWESVETLKIRTYMIGLQQKIMEISDKNVFVSEFLKDSSRKMYGIDGVTIENGTNMYSTYEMNKEKIETSAKNWRNDFHAESDIVIGYAGRITEGKGVIELLEAFKQLSREMKNVYLYFSGSYSDNVYKEIRKKSSGFLGNKVFFVDKETLPKPFSPEEEIGMAKIYRCFDLVVYPSYYEPFGLVPLEAVSCNTPVLVRNVDNLSYFVKEGICEGFGYEKGVRPAPEFDIQNYIKK